MEYPSFPEFITKGKKNGLQTINSIGNIAFQKTDLHLKTGENYLGYDTRLPCYMETRTVVWSGILKGCLWECLLLYYRSWEGWERRESENHISQSGSKEWFSKKTCSSLFIWDLLAFFCREQVIYLLWHTQEWEVVECFFCNQLSLGEPTGNPPTEPSMLPSVCFQMQSLFQTHIWFD